MPRIGTGYVEIQADWSAFDAVFSREANARLKAAFDGLGAKVSEAVDGSLGDKTVHVDVDVDRDRLSRLGGDISNTIGKALQGASASIGGLFSNLPGVGGLFSGLTSSLGTTALGSAAAAAAIAGLVTILAALAASLGAAIAGLGALAVAFAAALGPAVLVAAAAFARFVAIVKAVKDHNDNAAASARGVAAAHDQLHAATVAVANAQSNVREQTTAAYSAWADAVERVHDDLLSVQDAQEGINRANLSTREAEQALADFRKEAGAAGNAFDQAFKKFTDVNVDTSGLKGALLGAADASGTQLDSHQELKLEELIQRVRDAKLGEKKATDTLSDSTRNLARDRKTEADFADRGIKAYRPYRDALKQVSTAQQQVASAQRASATASERQTKAFDKLSPAERKFGAVLLALGDTLSAVFTPVMDALLPGVTRGLESFTSAASDPGIGKVLVGTGKALGDTFANVSKTLTSPEMRRAFADFAAAGITIVRTFGTKVFTDLALVLTRIAVATLPLLLPLLDKVAGFFDGLERSSRNRKNLQDDIKHLVDVFKDWASLTGRIATVLFEVGKFLEPIGTGIVRFITHPLRELGGVFGASQRDARAFAAVFAPIQRAVAANIRAVIDIFRGMSRTLRGIVRIIAGALTLNFREMGDGIKDVFRGIAKSITGILGSLLSPLKALGGRLGRGLMNALIDALNLGIRAIDKIIGTINSVPGVPNIGKIDTLDHVKAAPNVTGTIETRLPRKPRLVVRTSSFTPRFAGVPEGGPVAGTVQNFGDIVLPPAPVAAVQDARFQAAQFAREIAKRR